MSLASTRRTLLLLSSLVVGAFIVTIVLFRAPTSDSLLRSATSNAPGAGTTSATPARSAEEAAKKAADLAAK